MNNHVFFRTWLSAPFKIAAIAPSGDKLCRSIAKHALGRGENLIIELGSGTGEITRALVDQGLALEDLYLFELMPEFCKILRRNFPNTTIMEGDVCEQLAQLRQNWLAGRHATTVVSSLPIIWFSLEQQRSIIEQSFALMKNGGRFLQLTNQPLSPLPMKKLGLRGKPIIWEWNLSVPGIVWAYERRELCRAC